MGKAVNVSVDSDSRSLDENDRLIRKFSKKVKKLGLMDLLREKRYFISKSEKKRIKKRKKRRLSREDTAKRNKY
jgi:ribosomal protein S21